ncbi:glycerophosphodiester phosphodiesterase [Leifsonia poae]|uniref:glycerophosphodiester phosphodiesterase n=1 Tax=Leifsonia poae TaxID=110933 RepID=UPI0022F289E3|nr:glycerophosphodiester phosphodiesterase family protein [Leifsonia poae]
MPEPTAPPSADASRPSVTRRAFLIGAVGAAAAVTTAAVLAEPLVLQNTIFSGVPRGKRVSELFASDPFTVAHRGGSADWPEMSLFAYQQSAAHHVDALEISLARTADGVWFGLHDATLDRTSGTSGFVAADHTWSEVSKHTITAAETNDPAQPRRPYLRFEDLLREFGETHTIFIDPKVVPAEHFPELLKLTKRVSRPRETFVAKGYCTSGAWPAFAAEQKWRSWGYYYGAEIEVSPELLSSTQARWSSLGLDYQASSGSWSQVTALGKPVIAHIIPTRTDADRVRTLGAQGLMISGVTEVLG